MHLGTISGFERRPHDPQPDGLRAILVALDLEDEVGDVIASGERKERPADVRVFLDEWGCFSRPGDSSLGHP